ncbi:MAG: SpoVR family protein [Deltaproteobacteria bacterium]|nr:SpoVR family protein [Deltaproteobacteria bacterium]
MTLENSYRRFRDEIREHAVAYGLDFFEVVFEVVDFNAMNVIASYGGFANRYPHWRFGMQYEQLSKSYSYGLTKIYEMVINNDPCYAYLLEANSPVDQKTVMAHVYGHSDFFKNNHAFAKTNRKMIDEMGNHRAKVFRLMSAHGMEAVEDFCDTCLSLDNLIDYQNPGSPRDLLLVLLEKAPLETWQQEILSVIREEAYYFAPQAATKIMNEGWAAYWHSKIMTEKALHDNELIDYADHHSGTLAPSAGKLNPYKIGMELFKDVEERWNKGKFGKEYEECPSMVEKQKWDRKLGQGREKVFEVRKFHTDVTFMDAFLTEEFCRRNKLYTYAYNPNTGTYEITDRDFPKVKEKLLQGLTNIGQPVIQKVDDNYEGRGELYLKQQHEGVDLRIDYAKETLKNLYAVWKKPVHLETIVESIPKILSHDADGERERRLD